MDIRAHRLRLRSFAFPYRMRMRATERDVRETRPGYTCLLWLRYYSTPLTPPHRLDAKLQNLKPDTR